MSFDKDVTVTVVFDCPAGIVTFLSYDRRLSWSLFIVTVSGELVSVVLRLIVSVVDVPSFRVLAADISFSAGPSSSRIVSCPDTTPADSPDALHEHEDI